LGLSKDYFRCEWCGKLGHKQSAYGETPNAVYYDDGELKRWYHPECARKAQEGGETKGTFHTAMPLCCASCGEELPDRVFLSRKQVYFCPECEAEEKKMHGGGIIKL